jgi:FemAB-related protein (PEP-CTERM system-associated)
MISVTRANDGDAAEWNSFVRSHPGVHHALAWEWRRILSEAFQHKPCFLIARKGARVCGVAPLFQIKSPLFGNALVSSPYLNGGGVLVDGEEGIRPIVQEIEKIATGLHCDYVELRHRAAVPFPPEFTCRSHKVALVLPLQQDPEALFKTFPSKLRSQIRRPEKSGLTAQIRGCEAGAISDFYSVFAENMRDLGTPVYPRALFETAGRAFGTSFRVVTVHHESRPIAAGITIGFGSAVEIPWASSLRKFNALSGNMLLYWEAIRLACLDGAESFDFGRSSPDSGTHRFKLQWGPKEVPLHWYYKVLRGEVPDVNPYSPKYRMLVKCWQRLPLPIANVIGPWLTRGLP